MNKGPSLFSDIGKKARDLLIRDFTEDKKLRSSTYKSNSLVFKSGNYGLSQKGSLRYKNTLVDTMGILDGELKYIPYYGLSIATAFTIFPSTSTKVLASVKLPDYNSSKVKVQYFHDHATFTAAVAAKQSPDVDLSVTLGNPTLAFGAKARYKTSTGKFTMCTAGIGLTMPDDSLSAILGDEGDSLKVSFVKNVEKWKGTTLAAEWFRRFSTKRNKVTVGCSQILDPLTQVKVKLTNKGTLFAVLQHELKPKTLITVYTAFNVRNSSFKFGVSTAILH